MKCSGSNIITNHYDPDSYRDYRNDYKAPIANGIIGS